MQIIEAGHVYELSQFLPSHSSKQELVFVKREGGNLIYDGTTNEEVLAVLIDRMKWLNAKCPCRENSIVITKLEESLMWLNKRTELRVAQGVETKDVVHVS